MIEKYSRARDGNINLSANFKVKEFACKDGSDYILVSTDLVKLLQNIRNHFGRAVTINSAYRNAVYNRKIGGVSNSQHVYGTAADIVVSGVAPLQVAQYVETVQPNSGGIGLYGNFTHVDVRVNRARWQNYGREISVSGFYSQSKANKNYYIQGTTHIVEVAPNKIWGVETQCRTKQTP